MDMNISLNVDVEDLIESLYNERNYEDLIDIVLKLDLRIADCSFTEKLIKGLFESLEGDMTRKEGLDIISDLEEIVKKNFKEKF